MRSHRIPTLALAAGLVAAAIGADVLLSACATPTGPDPVGIVVTISAAGVTPEIASGASVRVEFVNQDSEPHDIRSNPHPGHNECGELNAGVINPGMRIVIPPIGGGRSCGYHDDTRPDDRRFQGSVVSR